MVMSAGRVRVGISGWRYTPWRGSFYPRGLQQRRELEYASRALPTIELNGSFYSLQRPSSYASWCADTPDDFVFSVKGPKFITQILRLRDADTPLANFLASGLANLGEKLGPILWQLPPSMRYDEALLRHFLEGLPRDTDEAATLACMHDAKVEGRSEIDYGPNRPLRHAMEVRNDSFVDPSFVAMLREHGVALVIADTGGRWPQYEDLTADFVYIRLHGEEKLYVSGYADKTIAYWSKRIRLWSQGSEPRDARRIVAGVSPRQEPRDVFCYFDNTAKEEAPHNAQAMMRMLEPASRSTRTKR
jgi:uncharacterized protein YecE (DUF72 family)